MIRTSHSCHLPIITPHAHVQQGVKRSVLSVCSSVCQHKNRQMSIYILRTVACSSLNYPSNLAFPLEKRFNKVQGGSRRFDQFKVWRNTSTHIKPLVPPTHVGSMRFECQYTLNSSNLHYASFECMPNSCQSRKFKCQYNSNCCVFEAFKLELNKVRGGSRRCDQFKEVRLNMLHTPNPLYQA